MKFFFKKLFLYIALVSFMLVGGYLFFSPPTTDNPWKKILGKPEYMKVDPEKPINTQYRLVEIAGRRFNIPLKYIDGQLQDGIVQQGMNLKYMLPEFKSLWDLKDRDEYLKMLYAGHAAHMLIEGQDGRPSIDVSANNLLKSYQKTEYIGEFYGLSKYLGYRTRNGSLVIYDEFYLDKARNGEIVGFLHCAPASRAPNPGCSYYFLDNHIRYNIYINAHNYLSLWNQQGKNAVNFIDSFEIKSQPKIGD